MEEHLKRKHFFPVGRELENFLKKHGRAMPLSATYEALRNFESSYPLLDTHQHNLFTDTP